MILITGGMGFLGQEVVRNLLFQTEHKLRCLVRPGSNTTGFQSCLDKEFGEDRYELFSASFNDVDTLKKALDGIEIVIHMAASLLGSIPAQTANTVIGTENLLQAVIASSKVKRFVLCSSFGVIRASEVKGGKLIDEAIPLENKPERRDPYSFTKLMQEELLWDYHKKYDLPLVVIRPGVVFGPPQPILTARFGISMFGFFLHFGGNNRIPLTYKSNCADALIQAALVNDINGEAFCIVDDDLPTSASIVKRYKKEIGNIRSIRIPYLLLRQLAKVNTWYYNKTNGHLPEVFTTYKVDTLWQGHIFSNKKAKKMLHWHPQLSMDEAINRTFQSMKVNQ